MLRFSAFALQKKPSDWNGRRGLYDLRNIEPGENKRGNGYFFASNSGRYCPYPSSFNFSTGMNRKDAELMQ
jgi:hypothetical protein